MSLGAGMQFKDNLSVQVCLEVKVVLFNQILPEGILCYAAVSNLFTCFQMLFIIYFWTKMLSSPNRMGWVQCTNLSTCNLKHIQLASGNMQTPDTHVKVNY